MLQGRSGDKAQELRGPGRFSKWCWSAIHTPGDRYGVEEAIFTAHKVWEGPAIGEQRSGNITSLE